MNKVIGFIGLGNMGKGMSKNLSKNNLKILGFDINDKVFNQINNDKIIRKDDIKSLTEESDIIITMLPDSNAVQQVWTEMIKCSRPNQCFIDCSTIDVKTSNSVQAKAQEKGLVEKKEQDDTIPLDTVITLDLLTSNKDPDKKK